MVIPPRNKRKARFSPERETKPSEPPYNADMSSSSPSSSSCAVADNFSSSSTQPVVLPPGYKFVPEDDELILHYLKPFLKGDIDMLLKVPIHLVNIYQSNPQELSDNFEKGNKKEWFFLSTRTKIAPGGKNQRRCDTTGYWNGSAPAKAIKAGKRIVGYKRVLNHYVKKKPVDVKEDWLMVEYWLESSDHDNEEVDYALCKMYLNPQALNKKKQAEEEENEKLKNEEGMALMDHITMQQPPDVEYQQQPLYDEYQQQQPSYVKYQQQPLYVEYQQQQISTASLDYSHQPNQLQLEQQAHDIAFQLEQMPCHYNLDDFPELINFEQQPVIPEDFNDFMTEFNDPQYPLDGDGDFNNGSFF